MRRFASIAGVAIMVAALITSCAATPEESSSPTVITFWNPFVGGDRPAVEALVEKYNESQSDYRVDMTIMGGDVLGEKLLPAYRAEEGPTLLGHDPTALWTYADLGVIQPIDDLYEDGVLDEATLPPAQIAVTTWEGKRYGAPMSAATAMLYYNKDLLSAAGIDTPAPTLDGLLEQSSRLTQYVEGSETTNVYGFAIPDSGAVPVWAALFWSYGGGIIDADGKTALMDSAGSVAASDAWIDAIRNDHISPVGLTGVDAQTLFTSGRAAFIFEGPWASAVYNDAGIDYGVVPFPEGPEAQMSVAVGAAMAINSDASDAERAGAADFMAFWNSVESQTYWAIETSYPPNRTDIDSAAVAENPTAAAFAVPQNGTFFPGAPTTELAAIAGDVFVPAIQRMMNGEGDPADVLAEANTQLQALLDEK